MTRPATRAARLVAQVVDPELPMLTLDDLGVVRGVEEDGDAVVVTITPTWSGCPALEVMRADIRARLAAAGYREVTVRTVLAPPWTTDLITERGRRRLADAGIAPPAPNPVGPPGPVPLRLHAAPPPVTCPRCGEPGAEEISAFGPTACTGLRRCPACREPFQWMRPR